MSFPAPTTGIGVAAKILVAGNNNTVAGKSTVPGYNDVVLSLSGANGPTTFQLNPQLTDVKNTPIVPGTSYTLTSVAASSGPGILVASAIAASTGGTAVITVASGGTANQWVGYSFVVAGFGNGVNNGTFVATASASTSLTVENPFAVAETHAATATSDEGVAVYTGTITETANSLVGKSFVVAGFVTNPTNNGTFVATANNGSTTLTLENPAAVGETHAATAKEQQAEWTDAITSVASSTGVYTGVFPEFASFPVGAPVTITGFVTNTANNGTFAVVSATSTTLTTTNTASVSETHAAVAQVNPFNTFTYFVDGTAQLVGAKATGPNTNLSTRQNVVAVSATGLLTAQQEGGSVVEVSFPTFSNTSGTTGAITPNPMTGLPKDKIYAEVNVTVVV